MAQKSREIIRLTAAALIVLVSTLFVGAFSRVQMNILRHGYELRESVLPSLCLVLLEGSFVGYVVAAGVVGLGLFAILRTKQRPVLYELSIQLAYLWSVVSVLTCLLAWWLPHAYGVSEVR